MVHITYAYMVHRTYANIKPTQMFYIEPTQIYYAKSLRRLICVCWNRERMKYNILYPYANSKENAAY